MHASSISLILASAVLFSARADPPSVTTLKAAGTNGDAVLNGVVNPRGPATTAWFEWGSSVDYGNETPLDDAGNGTTDVPVSMPLTGLTPGVAYHYRLVATNSAGRSNGQDGIYQAPRIILAGPNPMTNECHSPFADPGASGMAAPLAIAAGSDYSLELRFDGTVAAWGGTGNGETSVPSDLNDVVAIAAGAYHGLALKNNGAIVGWGLNLEGEADAPPNLSNVVAIAAGNYYSLALKVDGTVAAWGRNAYGQTNVPPGLSDVVAVAAGSFHALALRSNGTVVGWGYDAGGQIDVPTNLINVIAIAAGWNASLALKHDGTVVGWGQTSVPIGLSNVVAISAGNFYSLALKRDGTIVGWGFDFYGPASGPTNLTDVTAIAAGGAHALAVEGNGTLVAWGYDLYGQTNIPPDIAGNIQVSGAVNPNAPGAYNLNYAATDALGGTGTATRTVVVGDTTPPTLTLRGAGRLTIPANTAFVDPGATAFDARAGDLTSNVIVSGTVDTTALGTNTLTYAVTDPSGNTALTNRVVTTVVGSPFVTTLAAIGTNGDALLSGTVNPNSGATMAWFEWGMSILHGYATGPIALGSGLTNVSLRVPLDGLVAGIAYHFRLVATNSAGCSSGRDVIYEAPATFLRGASPMTNECHTTFLDPGAVTSASPLAIGAGQSYSLALKADNTVVAWGNAPSVPPGLTNVTAVAAGYIHCLALKADGTVAGWGENNFTPVLIPPGLSNVMVISVGFDLCLAVKQDGRVVGWGQPPFGGTVPPKDLGNVVAIAAGESYGLALKSDGTVVGWGYNGEGQVSIPKGLSNVVAIAAGFYHSLALKNDGTVVGWGDDFYGEATPPAGLSKVIAIAAGASHSLALKSDGRVVGWGLGFYGETDTPSSVTNETVSLYGVGTVDADNPHTYTLAYTTTNTLGIVGTVTRTVIVVDTTPPALSCPTNVSVEFADERGAPAFFTVNATDLCSGTVPVSATPPSGSTFPVGSTTVLCTAADPSGNSASRSFQVTVLGAQGVKSNVLAELIALRSGVKRHQDLDGLDKAISRLSESLDTTFWIDQTHLNRSSGETAFNLEKAAVLDLTGLVEDKFSTVSNAVVQAFVGRIVKGDRLLAVVATQDAAKAGADPKKLVRALEDVAEGDSAVARANYEAGIEHYRAAWSLARQLSVKLAGRVINGAAHLEFPAAAGDTYVIEASTNLVEWTTVAAGTVGTNGKVQFDDVGSHYKAGFYRAKLRLLH